MTRKVAENTSSLSVFFLKEHGFLTQEPSSRYGGIRWIRGFSENRMSFWVKIEKYGGRVELIYTYSNSETREKADMRYDVTLTTIPLPSGGRRYYFRCPLSSHGIPCGKRVAILYSVGKWFGCRYCANIAYQAQFEGGELRVGSNTEPNAQKAYDDIKTKFYNGKPTRKYRRYLRLRENLDNFKAKVKAKYGIDF